MGAKTGIQWTDVTWNPMTGCTRVSAGCDRCYAADLAARRLGHLYRRQPPVHDTPAGRADPFAPRFWEERLAMPQRWRTPRRVFVNSMSDVFHAHFGVGLIRRVFDAMAEAPQHQFQLLTKRPERARRLAEHLPWPENVWVGVSVEDMRVAHRVDALRALPAAVRFVSAEPLLGPLHGPDGVLDLTGVDWVIGGGESGAGYRPVDPAWARGLRDLCARAGVAFFWKQWGGPTPKAGGRILDGRVWEEYPRAAGSPPATSTPLR